jgi:aminoglycoside 6'-N-acetyltransferase
LLLRPFDNGDLEPFVAYRSDPEVARYQGWDAPYSEEQARLFLDDMKKRKPGLPGWWYQIAIELRQSGALIGDCAFCVLADYPQQAEIGFTLAQAYQGRGYAAEAVTRLLDYLFGDLKLHRVRAVCDVENMASSRLLERLGMRREAHFVQNTWFKGRWSSEYWYAILREEWAARQQTY